MRSPQLLEARQNTSADSARLRALGDQNLLRGLARQKELGFEICTDGELRRRNFVSDFTDAVEGLDCSGSVGQELQITGGDARRRKCGLAYLVAFGRGREAWP